MYVSVNYFCHIFLTQFGAHLSVLSRSPGTPVCPVQVSWHTCLSCPSLLAHLSALSKSPGTPVCPVQVSGHTCLSMSRSPRWPLATPDDCLVRKQADGYSGQLLSFCPRHGVSLSSVHVMQFPCPPSTSWSFPVLCPLSTSWSFPVLCLPAFYPGDPYRLKRKHLRNVHLPQGLSSAEVLTRFCCCCCCCCS